MVYKHIVFDMGGVLIENSGFIKMFDWMENCRMDLNELFKMWLFSPSVRSFEGGQISPEVFGEQIVKEFSLKITPEQFISEFGHFVKGFFPGVEDLLIKLSNKYPLSILSNTNEIHWNMVLQQSNIDKYIKRSFLSYQIGKLKPDRSMFLYVVNELGCQPSDIIFFDDSQTNVDAAKEVGIAGVYVKDFNVLHKEAIKLLV